jgi:uncharacterized protein (TIGR03437 family)
LFLAKINSTGSGLLFSTFLADECGSAGLVVDGGGNSYVAMQSGYANIQNDAVSTSLRAVKVNPGGTGLVYDRAVQGNSRVVISDFLADSSGNSFVAGSTTSSDFPIPSSCFRSVEGVPVAETDFVLRLDPGGEIADGEYLPLAPDPNRTAPALGMDLSGNVYIADLEEGGAAVRKLAPSNSMLGPERLRCVAHSGTLGKSPVAPGEIVSLFGDGIWPDKGANLEIEGSGTVANVLGNTQVFFDGIPSPLLYTQSHQINTVVPWEIQGRQTTEICVVYLGEKTNCIEAPVSEVSPGFFRIRPNYIAALNEDWTINTPENPAQKGSIVTLFLTGSGGSVPPQSDGEVTQGVRSGALSVEVAFYIAALSGTQIDVFPAEVLFHGPAPALVSGVEIVQVRVPVTWASYLTLKMLLPNGQSFEDTSNINYGFR